MSELVVFEPITKAHKVVCHAMQLRIAELLSKKAYDVKAYSIDTSYMTVYETLTLTLDEFTVLELKQQTLTK